MTDCYACEAAEANWHTGHYQAGCLECEARAIAHSPAAKRRHADPSGLQAAMRGAWPEVEQYKRGRLAAWKWIQRFEPPSKPIQALRGCG